MAHGYFLQNQDNEYLKALNTAEGTVEFTTSLDEACNYKGRPGGGQWDALNEKEFITYHFSDEYGDKVNTLECVYKEW